MTDDRRNCNTCKYKGEERWSALTRSPANDPSKSIDGVVTRTAVSWPCHRPDKKRPNGEPWYVPEEWIIQSKIIDNCDGWSSNE